MLEWHSPYGRHGLAIRAAEHWLADHRSEKYTEQRYDCTDDEEITSDDTTRLEVIQKRGCFGESGTSMAANQDFSSVPILDFALTQDPATRPEFLDQLRNALINVGFLYLSNPPVSQDDIDLVIDYAPKLFTIPQEKKDKLLMRNNPHFLGYTKIGAEYTKGKADQREQYDFATPYESQWTPGAPDYLKLWGPAQVSVH